MFEKYCLGIDVSVYQSRVDWLLLYEAGVRFAIIRSSCGNAIRDARFAEHLSGARKAGMICGAYHYFTPSCSVSSQMSCMQAVTAGQGLDFVALDVEQYWIQWDESQRANKNNHFSPQLISQASLEMAKSMRQAYGKTVVIYTRASFVNDYAAPMSAWLPDWPLWLAHYPYARGKVTLDWAQLKRNHAPGIQKPKLPRNCTDWKFWQFSGDKFILPGVNPSPLDLNFFHGSTDELESWLRGTSNPKQFTPEEKISMLWQAHPQLWQEG